MDLATVGRRLDSLERSRRTWRRSACVACVVAVAAFAWGAERKAPVSEEVVTKGIRVVDGTGADIFVVGTSPKTGEPFVQLLSRGREAFSLFTVDNATSLSVRNLKGETSIDLLTDKDNAMVMVNRDARKLAAGMGVKGGEGIVTVYGKDGRRTLERPEPIP